LSYILQDGVDRICGALPGGLAMLLDLLSDIDAAKPLHKIGQRQFLHMAAAPKISQPEPWLLRILRGADGKCRIGLHPDRGAIDPHSLDEAVAKGLQSVLNILAVGNVFVAELGLGFRFQSRF
jgi:hypothetical protein